MLKGIGGIFGVGPPQPSQTNPTPQFQNPYGAPTIYNPYSPADQRQFGFQIPYQLQMNQQRQMQQQQPQRPAFMDNPEFQGYQKQSEDLNRQMNDYVKQAPMYKQLQDLQGKMQGFQKQYEPQGQAAMRAALDDSGMGRGGQQQFNPYQRQQFNPYQMYGGLGGLFGMQNAYAQQPQQSTQAQINAANQQFLQRGQAISNPAPSTTGVTNSRQPAQQDWTSQSWSSDGY
jgi:hypothetical protein